MRWFGQSWGAPVNEYEQQVSVPVGSVCARCGYAVEEGDQGVEIPYVPEHGLPDLAAWHRACFLEAIVAR